MASGDPSPPRRLDSSVVYFYFVLAVSASVLFAAVSFWAWAGGFWPTLLLIGLSIWWYVHYDKANNSEDPDPLLRFSADVFLGLLPAGLGWIFALFLRVFIEEPDIGVGVVVFLIGAVFICMMIGLTKEIRSAKDHEDE